MKGAWNRFAPGYDEHITPFSMRVGEDAAGRLDLKPGMSFLDVAAGGGALCVPVAKRGAHVLATDFAPAMVERLKERAVSERLQNFEVLVMDGQALELEDQSFDAAGSQFGVMLFPDRARGLRELFRVTKPGGEVVIVAFGPPPKVEIFSLFFAAIKVARPDFVPPAASPIFSLQDPDQLSSEMINAGACDVRVDAVTHTMEVHSAEHFWGTLISSAPPGCSVGGVFDGRPTNHCFGRA